MICYMWLTLIASMDEAIAELQSGRKMKALQMDNGGKFTSIEFGEYKADHGIHR